MQGERAFPVSVIIPTHNRRDRLRATLDALATQSFPMSQVQVVIVADGCRDDTVAMLRGDDHGFALTIVERAGEGPAVARNAGAAVAVAPLLVFLDDDVEPTSGWLAAHVSAHESAPGGVVIGPYPPIANAAGDPFRVHLRSWWDRHFEELARPGHRFTFRDLLTGNLSMSAELWRRIDGLDPRFARAREDWELGIRLMDAAVPFRYAPAALAWHHEHETMDLPGSYRRSREEGRSDVRMGTKHPFVKPELPAVRYRLDAKGLRRLPAWLAFRAGGVDPLFTALGRTVAFLRRHHMRRLYYGLNGVLLRYWYLRGVAEELGSIRDWHAFSHAIPVRKPKARLIDLSDGFERAEEKLARWRPEEVRILFGATDLGYLSHKPFAERWDARHLRPHLARELRSGLLYALLEEDCVRPKDQDPSPGTIEVSTAWWYLGVTGFQPAMDESYLQWRCLN